MGLHLEEGTGSLELRRNDHPSSWVGDLSRSWQTAPSWGRNGYYTHLFELLLSLSKQLATRVYKSQSSILLQATRILKKTHLGRVKSSLTKTRTKHLPTPPRMLVQVGRSM